MLRHESGLGILKEQIDIEWTKTEQIKQNKIGRIIEESHTERYQGTTRAYHPTSRDWITNEIFRRVEAKGRTMGEYMQQELKPFFGESFNVYMGVPDAEYKKCFPFRMKSIFEQVTNFMFPYSLGRESNLGFIQLLYLVA